METVRIGIIGVGGMGTFHTRYLKAGEVSDAELVAVCDIEPEKMDKFEDLKKFATSQEMIRSGEVDAVIVATPHYDHTTIGIDALENGIHLLVEKPISVHKADCERLIGAWEKNKNLAFQAMFQMRTDAIWRKIKSLIDNGELGEITRVNWIVTNWFRSQAYYSSGGWRATWKGEGGGVLMNQCPHNLDIFQWLFGMPKTVKSYIGFGAKHDIEVDDEVTAVLEYPNGSTGVFITSTGESPGTNRLEICGEQGRIVVEGGKISFVRNEVQQTKFSKETPTGFSSPDTWNIEIPVRGGGASHKAVTQNFVNVILKGEERIAPAEEGIKSVELANAMLYSAWTGDTVKMPLDAAAYEEELKKKIATSKADKKEVKKQDEDMGASFR